jgi:hypothetical protein
MSSFVIVYRRSAQEIVELEQFQDDATAFDFLVDRQRKYGVGPDLEIVLLGAESEEALRRTHARYFSDVGELAAG